jgi:hypothetical protein
VHDVTLYWRPMCGYCEVLKTDLARRALRPVTGDRDELNAARNCELPREVGQEDERALEHAHEQEVLPAVLLGHLFRELDDLVPRAVTGDELNVPALDAEALGAIGRDGLRAGGRQRG